MARTAPYGSWVSPIDFDAIQRSVSGLTRVDTDMAWDGEALYWIEARPAEAGRNVIVRRAAGGTVEDLTPRPLNARSRVHEYGGGAFVAGPGVLFFSNFADQRLYRAHPQGAPAPVTAEGPWRYADGVWDAQRRIIFSVREDHGGEGAEPENTIVRIDPEAGAAGEAIVSGHDFFSTPRLSPDGAELAWLSWDHPAMPWDGTTLWRARLDEEGNPVDIRKIAGGDEKSVFEPQWSPDGRLYYVSDRSGWWNIYRSDPVEERAILPMEAEFGMPQWVFGMSTYAFESAGRIVCKYGKDGFDHLARIEVGTGRIETITTDLSAFGSFTATTEGVVFAAGAPTRPVVIARLGPGDGIEVLRRFGRNDIDPEYLSHPVPVAFPTTEGRTAHAFFYPPSNPDFRAGEGEKPPLVVRSHGGPTASASTLLNLNIQYFTSRGIAVCDVNYGGSTGYGRAYRERLNGRWGIVDRDDCANAALHLAREGLADRERLAIMGGSAGGYTTLSALTFTDVFKAGISNYGVADLEMLARDTHKFESRYLDSIVGPYPERKDLYQARSPIRFTDRLACAIAFFQGLEDVIVPPNQAEMMVEALRRKGVPVAYVAFEGEQHGFRRLESMRTALEGSFYFLSRVFGFTPGNSLERIRIENLG